MDKQKIEFIEFMIECGALEFGDFVTKSGRESPYFINTGRFNTGLRVNRLGMFYAREVEQYFHGRYDCLYGPAYKGIPLVVTTSAALASLYQREIPFFFNRKEVKDHGERGALVGYHPHPGDRVLVLEDVITAGTSVRETMLLFQTLGGISIEGLIVSVDREECGPDGGSALEELSRETGVRIRPIVTLSEICGFLHNKKINDRVILDDQVMARIDAYLKKYGCGRH